MRRWRTLPWIRLWVLCLLCLLLVSVLPFPGTAQAHVRAGTQPTLPERPIVNYSCGGNACYAQVTEQPSLQPVNPGSNFWGVQTTITPVQLYAQTGSINEDMWLSDTFLDGSTCPSTHSCWIEAGLLYEKATGGGPRLFWADIRPHQGPSPHCIVNGVPSAWCPHYGPMLTSADFGPGKQLVIGIYLHATSTWTITMHVAGGHASMTGTSTSNTMRPDNATIGQELHGSIGVAGQAASAQRAFFTQNKYLNTGGGQWYPYTSDGRQLVQGPTWGDGMEGKALLLLVMVALGTPVRSLQRASSTRGYLNTR